MTWLTVGVGEVCPQDGEWSAIWIVPEAMRVQT
jgi:hypothetical protein